MTSPSRPGGAFLPAEQPKGPWTGDAGAGGDKGAGNGPRNPWAVPPQGSRQTALDEFLKRARSGRGGGGGGLPNPPSARALWAVGAAALILAWLVFTAIHPIGPQQRGVVTYFGKYAGTLDPGIRVTLPAPIATVTKVDVQNIRTTDLPGESGERSMLTRDQNLIDLAYYVRWTISSPEDFVFQIKEPEKTVAAVAESAMREEIANVTLDEALGPGRDAIQDRVQERMQHLLDGYHSGVRIQGVAIKQADPPDAVNDAFKDVTAAQQDAQAARNNAEAYAQQKIALAQGEAAAFDAYYAQYKLAPDVTRKRLYYETMESVLANTDKTIVEVPGVAPLLPLDRARRPEPAAPAPGAGQ